MIGPLSMSTASAIDSPTTTAICQDPEPRTPTSRSATAMPTATPTISSAACRSRWLWLMPRLIRAAIGAKNGRSWPTRSVATSHASPAETDACTIANADRRSRRSASRTIAPSWPPEARRALQQTTSQDCHMAPCRSPGGQKTATWLHVAARTAPARLGGQLRPRASAAAGSDSSRKSRHRRASSSSPISAAARASAASARRNPWLGWCAHGTGP